MDSEFPRRSVLKAGAAITLVNLSFGYAGDGDPVLQVRAADRHGPMRTGRFIVEIDGVEIPGWRSVTIPASTTEQGEYRDGDEPDWEKKIWGATTFDDLEMERGVQSGDTHIVDWRDEVMMGNVDDGRKDVVITLLDEEGQPQVRWTFQNAWISYYDPPTLEASADGDVAMEAIELPFEKHFVEWDPTPLESSISLSDNQVAVGEEITFDASDSSASEQATYSWDFGDGNSESGEVVAHSYDTEGQYWIELTVEDDARSDSSTRHVVVEPSEEEEDEPAVDSEYTISTYANEDGVIDDEGAAEAFEDFEAGLIDSALLLEVVDAWRSGEVVDDTGAGE